MQIKWLAAGLIAAIATSISALASAQCPAGKIEVVRTNPSGKTHTQCVSDNASGGVEQAADNAAGTVTYATFTPLGQLPGGSYFHSARDVSVDGSVVVGYAVSDAGMEAFRWTEADGMVGLGDFPGGRFFSGAFGVSADGSVVVGCAESSDGILAFRWTTALQGMVPLGEPVSFRPDNGAWGVSADGSVIAVTSGDNLYRWTEAGGIVMLGSGYAKAISADGAVIVGALYYGAYPFYEAFRWTEDDGVLGLGALSGAVKSYALGVSPDGSVVVGRSGYWAFQWTEAANTMVPLPGGLPSYAMDASENGSVIVGRASFPGYESAQAVLWTLDGGMQLVQELLEAQGVDLTGWCLTNAMAVSPSGRILVGAGVINPPEGCELVDEDADNTLWIATLPLP
jgi:probable HAF family extracellular repeat protein